MMSDKGLAELRRHEGFEARPYRDSVGVLTVGYGWNLESDPMCREAAEVQMKCKLADIEQLLMSRYDWYPNLSQARKDVVLNMCYNLGIDGFGKFRNTIWLIQNSRFQEASREMLNSKWAEQVGGRARTLADNMDKG
jgi:lysozyme